MRLAPTGIPMERRSSLPTRRGRTCKIMRTCTIPCCPAKRRSAHLRELIGEATLDAYLATRGAISRLTACCCKLTANGRIDRLVLGQDDAGPVGLHVRDVAPLQSDLAAQGSSGEPRSSRAPTNWGWRSSRTRSHARPVDAAYCRSLFHAGRSLVPRQIEYAPISTAIDALIGVCGGVRDDNRPDIILYVRVPGTTPALDDALIPRCKPTPPQPLRCARRSLLSALLRRSSRFARRSWPPA